MGLRTCLFIASLAVLIAGLSAALAVYVTAEDQPELTPGAAVLQSPGSSKLYIRDLQRFGGKSSVLFDEILRWFDGLWQGRTLGKTLAVLSVALSLGIFAVARRVTRT